MTEGDVVDYDQIREDIIEICKQHNVREIAVDRWNSTQLVTQLDGEGLNMAMFGQGYRSMSGPSKQLEALVMGRKLRHAGNPILRWMASNVAIESDPANNIKPSKKKSTEKIDGIVATVMGLARAIAAQDDGDSIYESKGLTIL